MNKTDTFHYESDDRKGISQQELEEIKQNELNGIDLVILIDTKTLKADVVRNLSKNIELEDLYKDGKIHDEALQEVIQKGFCNYEWSIEKSGKRFLYQSTLIPLTSAGKNTTKIVALARDITFESYGWSPKNDVIKEWAYPKRISQLLLIVRETEKKEIAKALHDEIGSAAVISNALIGCARASLKDGNSEKALGFINQLDEQVKDSISRLRNIIVSLRPPSLETDGALGDAIHTLLENISQFIHIPYKFDYKPTKGIKVDSEVRIVVYRAVQESLSNIVKHAKASNIYVLLERKKGMVRVVVQDDGVGFEPTTQYSINHLGLFGMKDSVAMLGGTISINSAVGKGTRIEIVCPNIVKGENYDKKNRISR